MINLSDRYLKKKKKREGKSQTIQDLKKTNKYKQLEKTATTYEQ